MLAFQNGEEDRKFNFFYTLLLASFTAYVAGETKRLQQKGMS